VTFIDFKHFEAAKFKVKWKTLYTDLKTADQMSMLFPAIFFLRRIWIVSFFYIDIISVRYAAILYPIQMSYFYYLIMYRPLKDELVVEIINEVIVSLCFLITPTHLTLSAKDSYNTGWILVTLFFLLFIVNIAFIIVPAI
jgi:hypothetical protein